MRRNQPNTVGSPAHLAAPTTMDAVDRLRRLAPLAAMGWSTGLAIARPIRATVALAVSALVIHVVALVEVAVTHLLLSFASTNVSSRPRASVDVLPNPLLRPRANVPTVVSNRRSLKLRAHSDCWVLPKASLVPNLRKWAKELFDSRNAESIDGDCEGPVMRPFTKVVID